MPRSKTGVTRPKVDINAIERAAADVLKNGTKIRTAARNFGVSKTTLDRHIKKFNSIAQSADFVYEAKYDVKKVFNKDQELEIVDYVKQAAKLHYGLTKKDVLKLAYDYGKANNMDLPKNWESTKSAGFMWLRGLRKRHPSLSLRKPEATSLSRATSFNKENIALFFKNLKEVILRYKFSPDKIFNLDETGISTVHVPPKIMCEKGSKQVGSLTSGERGVNVTMIVSINAIGNHVPPMFIFPRVHFKQHMLIGAPAGSIGGANPSGWSNEHFFVDYLNHFVKSVKPSLNDPVLLIIDNHESHITIQAIDFAKQNGVVILTLPPHTSHKMQPLDRTVFGPFKTYYNVSLNEWMLENPGKSVTIYDIAPIVGKVFNKAFTKSNIEKGFMVTGIYPLNENIFEDDEFFSSFVTDRPQNLEEMPSTSFDVISTTGSETVLLSSSHPPSTAFIKSPEMIRPFPKAQPRKKTSRGRKRGKTRILTDTPEKRELEKSKKKKYQPLIKRKISGKKNIASSSDEDNFDIAFEDSSNDDAILDEVTEYKQNDEDLEDISEGSFVLTKLAGKKSVSYFVAEVIKDLGGGELEIKYYKRCGDTNKFILEKDDIYITDKDTIERLLPAPVTTAQSERQAYQISFQVDFSAYNVR